MRDHSARVATRMATGAAAAAMSVLMLTMLVASVAAHEKRLHPLPVRPGALTPGLSNHTDQWAVIVATSRFWHNYRHATNALEFYRMCRDSGIPDSHIVLMLADDAACEPRNAFPTTVHSTWDLQTNTMCADVEVDFAGDSVTAINFLRVLSGRMPAGTSPKRQIFPGPNSNVIVYMTGHSGAHFMKFHDYDFLTSYDLGDVFSTMHRSGRYNRLLFVVDTCQAETIFTHISAPNAVSLASSNEHQNSLSHAYHYAEELANTFVDGFTHEVFRLFFSRFRNASQPGLTGPSDPVRQGDLLSIPQTAGLVDFFAGLDRSLVKSDQVWSHQRDAAAFAILKADWRLRDFFGPGYQSGTAIKPASPPGRAASGQSWSRL